MMLNSQVEEHPTSSLTSLECYTYIYMDEDMSIHFAEVMADDLQDANEQWGAEFSDHRLIGILSGDITVHRWLP
ncbi:hypothetical protein UFOVP233_32 [uncultured Caudovirales phage]|uniref:Uncharacterized protein n=1 Tax=uncultured Caudovirales phage TaxID=2100421 RepID=A0A6J7WZ28_9CAUD|nr:hypothetical protein UFOVP233_32 [uncultured Caudovirales phage]